MKLESVAQLLLGAVMGIRVLDSKKPLWARAGYGLVAADAFKDVFATPENPVLGDGSEQEGQEAGAGSPKPLQFRAYRVRTIQDRVAKVHEQMVAGTKDPKIYKLARETLTKQDGSGNWVVKEKDHAGEVTALFNEVRKRVRYTWDPTDYDAFQTAVRTLELHAGDCDDMTSLLGALCRSVGHRVRSRIVQTKGSSTWNHIYPVVYVQGWANNRANPARGTSHASDWMSVDPSVNKPAGWEVPREMVLKMKDFDVVE